MSFKLLKNYIQNKMKMSHIYQLIPRKEGDVENPQGGVRSVIPSKQHY